MPRWKFFVIPLLVLVVGVVLAAPARVTDLAVTNTNASSATVSYTTPAPGSGSLMETDIRVSTVPITALNWATRTTIAGEPIPTTPGAVQSAIVPGLSPGTTYYIAHKTRDSAGWSLVSNVVSTTLTAYKTATLKWTAPDAVVSPELVGYFACQSKTTANWRCIDVAKATTYTFNDLTWGSTDYFVAVAYYSCTPYPTYPCTATSSGNFVFSANSGMAQKD